jgi:hypothetical protein
MTAAMSDTSLRLRAWWRRDELDDRLAHGADPESDPLLARRAEQLQSRSTRLHIATALAGALDESRKIWSVSARLPLRRVEIRQCADDIDALVARLRDGDPIDFQGAAMAARLIFDGTGPMYRNGSISLRYAVRSARLALDPVEAVIDSALSRVA